MERMVIFMNEKKIHAVEDKIDNASILLNEIKSHYNEEDLWEDNRSAEQRLNDFKKLSMAIGMLHDCQLIIEDFTDSIMEHNKKISEADTHRIETIKILLGMNEEDLKKLRIYSHVVFGEGGATS